MVTWFTRKRDAVEAAPAVVEETDFVGTFRLERVPADIAVTVVCFSDGASGRMRVAAGSTARAEIRLEADHPRRHGSIGMRLRLRLQKIVVGKVDADGPAGRAGIAVGDVLRKVNDKAVTDGALYALVSGEPGTAEG